MHKLTATPRNAKSANNAPEQYLIQCIYINRCGASGVSRKCMFLFPSNDGCSTAATAAVCNARQIGMRDAASHCQPTRYLSFASVLSMHNTCTFSPRHLSYWSCLCSISLCRLRLAARAHQDYDSSEMVFNIPS